MSNFTEAYPGFCSAKRPGVFLLPPGLDAGLSQGYPNIKYAGTHLYGQPGGTRHCENTTRCRFNRSTTSTSRFFVFIFQASVVTAVFSCCRASFERFYFPTNRSRGQCSVLGCLIHVTPSALFITLFLEIFIKCFWSCQFFICSRMIMH